MEIIFGLIAIGFILFVITFAIMFAIIAYNIIRILIKSKDKNVLLFGFPVIGAIGIVFFVSIVFVINMIKAFV